MHVARRRKGIVLDGRTPKSVEHMTRMTMVWGRIAVLAFCASCLTSCKSLVFKEEVEPVATTRKTLQRQTLAPDAVVFDALIAHVPYNERELTSNLWNDVDEQDLDPNVRRSLNEQGFRVGVIGASPPPSLTSILALKGRGLRSAVEEEVDYANPGSTLSPISYSKPINLRSGSKSVIEMRSDVVPSIPILERGKNGELIGKTYSDASPIFSVAIEQNSDGSVLFDVAPFLRYGAPQSTTRYQHGQLVRTQERPTKSFDQLRFSIALRPGQFLVIGASDSKTNALSRYFFSEGGEDFEQTILVLRLLVTQHDEQFDRFPDFKTLVMDEMGTDPDKSSDDWEEIEVSFEMPDTAANGDSTGFRDYQVEDVDSSTREEANVELDLNSP